MKDVTLVCSVTQFVAMAAFNATEDSGDKRFGLSKTKLMSQMVCRTTLVAISWGLITGQG
jgi:hypothetical protein